MDTNIFLDVKTSFAELWSFRLGSENIQMLRFSRNSRDSKSIIPDLHIWWAN